MINATDHVNAAVPEHNRSGHNAMPTDIDHEELQRLTGSGALLLDVREREGYDAEHLPGAVSLPIKALDAETTAGFARNPPVITYCWECT